MYSLIQFEIYLKKEFNKILNTMEYNEIKNVIEEVLYLEKKVFHSITEEFNQKEILLGGVLMKHDFVKILN